MKRDMDLARSILLAIEASDQEPGHEIDLSIGDHTDVEVSYHVMLLHEAGLIEALDLGMVGLAWRPKRLTWQGHEFLEAARSDSLWERAKRRALDETGGLSLELLQTVLISLGKQAVGL